MTPSPRVAVFGEVVLDLIDEGNHRYAAHLGGSPYNLALGLARQEIPVTLLSPLSRDPVGQRFADTLTAAGGQLGAPPSPRPTSVALVWIDADGQPDYALHRGDVADLDTHPQELCERTPASVELVHTGALTLTPEAVGIVRPWMDALRQRGVLVSIDVNFRASATRHLDRYVEAVESVLPLCDLIKLSDEDLRGLGRQGSLEQEAERLLHRMADDTGMVVVTAGASGAYLRNRAGGLRVPALSARRVVDTVGAGDCFQAGLLAALLERKLLAGRAFTQCPRSELAALAHRAQAAAVLNVEAAGCQPPTLAALRARLGRPPS